MNVVPFLLLPALLLVAPFRGEPAADELVALLNAYRAEHGLPAIPSSPSLTLVAEAHVDDLLYNAPDQGRCTMHSWSRSDDWSGCCYTADHARASCMWNKPRELTQGRYRGRGYEIATWYSAGMTPERALAQWQSSPDHDAMILNEGAWRSLRWRAIGAAVSEQYAVVWFGEEAD